MSKLQRQLRCFRATPRLSKIIKTRPRLFSSDGFLRVFVYFAVISYFRMKGSAKIKLSMFYRQIFTKNIHRNRFFWIQDYNQVLSISQPILLISFSRIVANFICCYFCVLISYCSSHLFVLTQSKNQHYSCFFYPKQFSKSYLLSLRRKPFIYLTTTLKNRKHCG